jgi:hypothetical protein
MIHRFINALSYAFEMGWKIFWALLLGFTLSGAVQAVVTKGGMSQLLPVSRPGTILLIFRFATTGGPKCYA